MLHAQCILDGKENYICQKLREKENLKIINNRRYWDFQKHYYKKATKKRWVDALMSYQEDIHDLIERVTY